MNSEVGSKKIRDLFVSKENNDPNQRNVKDDLHKWGPGPEQGEYTTEKFLLFIVLENGDIELYMHLLSNAKFDANLTEKFTIMNPFDIFEKINVTEKTLLNLFVEKKNLVNINVLLKNKKIDLNAPDIETKYSQYTQLLHGRQTIVENESQTVSLQIAVSKKNVGIVKLLLQHKELILM